MQDGFDDLQNGIGFLHTKCKLIRPVTIMKLSHVQDFVDAVIEADKQGVVWSDEKLFEVVRDEYLRMIEREKGFKLAKDVLKQISKAVTGDINAWKNS